MNGYVKSPHNVRKTVSAAADEELKASILSHGLMQNLVVTKGRKGSYLVIAGARRLEALKSLQAEGKLPPDHSVPCQVGSEEHAAEMSLAENIVRQAMHPADEFEAFAALYQAGRSVGFIAERFGTTEKHVWQRLKLGLAAPKLLAEYRAGSLTLDCLMAFTVTDDQQKQVAVYESLEDWDRKNAHSIRRALTEEMVVSTDKLARFVGLEAYAAAGGLTRADLFGDRVYLESSDILRQLASKKLEAAAEGLRQDGWGWVVTATEHDWQFAHRCDEIESRPIEPPQELVDQKAKLDEELEAAEHAYNEDDGEDEARSEELGKRCDDLEQRLDEINEELEAYVAFDPDEMKLAGCYVYINGNGVLCVDKGLVKPEDKKAVARAKAGDLSQVSVEKPKGISDSLKRDLEVYRLGVAQAEIAGHPSIAFDLLVFKVASNILTMRSPTDGPAVRFEREFAHNAGKDARDFLKARMEPVAENLPKAWLEAGSESDQFLAFQQLSVYQKQAILAYCVAVALQPKLDTGGRPTAYDIALAQTGANVADYWRPSKDNFLSRITKDQLLEIGAGLVGGQKGKQWATTNAGEKKGDIAGELHRVFNSDDLPGMTAEQAERTKRWLPDGMAFREAPEPKPAKAKKGKKAA